MGGTTYLCHFSGCSGLILPKEEVDKPENSGAEETDKSTAAPPRGPDLAAQNGVTALSLTLADLDVGLGEGAGRQKRSSQQHAHSTAAAHRRNSAVLGSGQGGRRHWGQLRPHPRQEAAPHLPAAALLPEPGGDAAPGGAALPYCPAVRCGLAVISAGSSERKALAVLPGAMLLRSLCRPPASSTPCSCHPATRGNLQHQAEMLQNGCSRMSPFCGQNCVWK